MWKHFPAVYIFDQNPRVENSNFLKESCQLRATLATKDGSILEILNHFCNGKLHHSSTTMALLTELFQGLKKKNYLPLQLVVAINIVNPRIV